MTELEKRKQRKEELQAKIEKRNGYILDIHEISGALVYYIRELKRETDPEKIKWLKNKKKACTISLKHHIKKYMET
jgi:hypothetical protein